MNDRIDPNHDIVPTLRMFDGLMMNKAADEIETLRAKVRVLEAAMARPGTTPVAYEFLHPNGHAIVDYSEHTHVGHLTAEKGYVKLPLVYACGGQAQDRLTDEQLDTIAKQGSQTLASVESRRKLMRAAISADRASREAPDAAGGPTCRNCEGTGQVFDHADDCEDDLCALNGDMHSCTGKVEPCPECTPGVEGRKP